jgi:LAGLIDADG endonuclease
MHEAGGSNPPSSTDAAVDSLGFMLGGVVAGEGSFCVTRQSKRFVADGSIRKRFVFSVAMATRDRPLVEALHSFLGVGSLRDSSARAAALQPISTLTVNSVRSHRAAVIPFADRYLLPSAKRAQFERWRAEMDSYWSALLPKQRSGDGRSTCSVESCDRFVRARGLCRSHYYRETGW